MFVERKQLSLYQHLKSVAIMLQPDPTGADFEPSSKQLIDWFARYDSWFKESVGINDGHRPYALYGREVSLFGADLLSVSDKLRDLAASCIEKGFAVSLTVDILSLYREFDIVQSLCRDSLVSSIGIICDPIDTLADEGSLADFMSDVIGLRRPVGLIGPVSLLRKHELFAYESINATDITVYPSQGASRVEMHALPDHPVKKCANRIQLYIDHEGYIYPCLGMLGLTDYAMGHIGDDISGTALAGGHYPLDLPKLMVEGPELQLGSKPQQRMTDLPWICEQHRSELLGYG